MNRSRARELLPVIEAFANGEDVQIRSGDNEWSTFTIFGDGMGPDWSDDCVYRIKLKPAEGYVRRWDLHEKTDKCDKECIHVREIDEDL